jgi:hypothetical protein
MGQAADHSHNGIYRPPLPAQKVGLRSNHSSRIFTRLLALKVRPSHPLVHGSIRTKEYNALVALEPE